MIILLIILFPTIIIMVWILLNLFRHISCTKCERRFIHAGKHPYQHVNILYIN